MRHKPLGDTKKLKKGEQVLVCRGLKYVGRTTLDLEDGSTAPIRIRVIPFKYLSDYELGALNVNFKTKSALLQEMLKDNPDFTEREFVTIIFVDIESKVETPKGKSK